MITCNAASRMTMVDGKEVHLERQQFELLSFMISNRNVLLTYDRLSEAVWNQKYNKSSRTICETISQVRRRTGATIINVHGFGYRFEG